MLYSIFKSIFDKIVTGIDLKRLKNGRRIRCKDNSLKNRWLNFDLFGYVWLYIEYSIIKLLKIK